MAEVEAEFRVISSGSRVLKHSAHAESSDISADRLISAGTVACTAILTVATMATAVWAEQGLPFQDDWAFLYPFTPDGPRVTNLTSLFQPINDGVYPLVRLLLTSAWHFFGSMTPMVLLNVSLMSATSLGTLAYLRRHGGGAILFDFLVPICCLSPAILPSFAWPNLAYAFIPIAALVPLILMLLRPEPLRMRSAALASIAGFLLLAIANGAIAYTYGIGVACWCLIAACLMPALPFRSRIAFAALALIAGAGIIFLYMWTKDSHVSKLNLNAAKFSLVFSEMLAIGIGQIGATSRGILGIPLAVAVAYVCWQLIGGVSESGRSVSARLLTAGTAVIVLMPCIGVALARDDGLAVRYVPYGVPIMLWLYACARTLLPPRQSAFVTTAVAAMFAATFLYELHHGWVFAKERHSRAISLRNDAANGLSLLQLSSLHADTWALNKDERFARYLDAARKIPMFAKITEDPDYDIAPAVQITEQSTYTKDWQYLAFKIDQRNPVAFMAEYKPQRHGPYRLRWIVQHRPGEGVPVDRVETAVQSRDAIRRDYLWLPAGVDTVWIGIDRRANVDSIRGFLLRSKDYDAASSD